MSSECGWKAAEEDPLLVRGNGERAVNA